MNCRKTIQPFDRITQHTAVKTNKRVLKIMNRFFPIPKAITTLL